jgi:hypothetical protein
MDVGGKQYPRGHSWSARIQFQTQHAQYTWKLIRSIGAQIINSRDLHHQLLVYTIDRFIELFCINANLSCYTYPFASVQLVNCIVSASVATISSHSSPDTGFRTLHLYPTLKQSSSLTIYHIALFTEACTF